MKTTVAAVRAWARVRADESLDMALKRFKKDCDKNGVLVEARRRAYYVSANAYHRQKAHAAQRRGRR